VNDKQKKKRNELLYRKLLHGKLDHLPVKETADRTRTIEVRSSVP